jgi:hypothetical protein
VAAAGIAAILAACAAPLDKPQVADLAIHVGASDLGGVVNSVRGPEAGVWVIAETTDLPTRFTRIVVTDERGRYLIPELPQATYSVWVRGYGLVDSAKVRTNPGKLLNLNAVEAPGAAEAAEYYPAIYWYSMLRIPAKWEFPGTGPKGNRIDPGIRTQAQWLNTVKTNGCMSCHSLGTKGTRTIPKISPHEIHRGVGAAHHFGAGDDPNDQRRQPHRLRALDRAVGRLDRPYRLRRAAIRPAGSAARHRAQRRADLVGLEPAHSLYA